MEVMSCSRPEGGCSVIRRRIPEPPASHHQVIVPNVMDSLLSDSDLLVDTIAPSLQNCFEAMENVKPEDSNSCSDDDGDNLTPSPNSSELPPLARMFQRPEQLPPMARNNISPPSHDFHQLMHLKLHSKPSHRNIEAPPCDTPPALMSPSLIKAEPIDPFRATPPVDDCQKLQQQSMLEYSNGSFLIDQHQQYHKKTALGIRPSLALTDDVISGLHVSHSEYDPAFNLYHDMIMQLVNQDIQNTCAKLGLGQDPNSWNPIQVRAWVLETVKQQQLPMPNLERFQMPGSTFAFLTPLDFQELAPECGDRLYTCLQIWITARDYNPHQAIQRQQSLGSFQQNSTTTGLCLPTIHGVPENIVVDDSNYFNSWQQPPALIPMNPLQEMLPHSFHLPTQFDQEPSSSTSSPSGTVDMCGFPTQNIYQLPPLNVQSPTSPKPHTLASPSSVTTDDSGIHTDTVLADDSNEFESFPPLTTSAGSTHIHLWQFIRELLECPQNYGHCVRWLQRDQGIFKIEDSVRMAKLWGAHKNRPAMNYDKLSRSLRQYYKKGILQKTPRSQRLVYQFCHPYNM